MTIDEGVVKFDCRWRSGPPLADACLADLQRWRDRLFAANLIGFDEEHGVGFGNISERLPDGTVIISGTQTGHLARLDGSHYVRIDGYDIAANRVECTGPMRPSSEALTHLAIYELHPGIRAVHHAHHAALWQEHLHTAPTTAPEVPYGTPAMAQEFQRLYRDGGLDRVRFAVMGGHETGLVSFGDTHDEAGERLLGLLG